MTKDTTPGRMLGHAVVDALAEPIGGEIRRDPNLTEVQRDWAMFGLALVRAGGHVAVEVIAEEFDSEDD
jgi:hypothetical protein